MYVDVGLFSRLRESAQLVTIGDDPSSDKPYVMLVARYETKPDVMSPLFDDGT